MHYVSLWLSRNVERRGKEIKVAVQRTFARFGKPPVLPHTYLESADDATQGLKATRDMFAASQSLPGIGSHVIAMTSQDRPGRILTPRLHPRETSTLVGAIPVHRDNLDYQDLRVVVGETTVDSMNVCLPPDMKLKGQPNLAALRLLQHGSLRSGWIHANRSSMVDKKAADSLCSCLDDRDYKCLRLSAPGFFWHLLPCRGKADLPRVECRIRPREWRHFARWLVDSAVEAMRSAIQTGFYICGSFAVYDSQS